MRTGTQITIRASRLDLCDVFFAQAELLVDSEDIMSDRNRSHAICVVRDTTESGSRLACREGLPPLICPTIASVDYNLLDCSLLHKRNDHILAAQSIISAVPSEECIRNTENDKTTRIYAPSGPKNRISGLLYKSTRRSLIPGLCPGIKRSKTDYVTRKFGELPNKSKGAALTSTYFSKHNLGLAPSLYNSRSEWVHHSA
jgi:hypothetical protein